MRKNTLWMIVIGLLLSGCQSTPPQIQKPLVKQTSNQDQFSHNLIIWYDAKVGVDPLLKAVQRYGADILYRYEKMNGIAVLIPQDRSLNQAKSDFERVSGVVSVDIDQTMTIY